MPVTDQSYQAALNSGKWTPAEIMAALQNSEEGKQYIQSKQLSPGFWREAEIAGTSALSGLMGLAGAASSGLNEIGPEGARVMQAAFPELSGNPAKIPNPMDVTDRMGLTNPINAVPQGVGENLLAAGSRGVGAAVPAALSGGRFGVPVAAPLLTGALSGAAAEEAHELFPQSGVAPILAGSVVGT